MRVTLRTIGRRAGTRPFMALAARPRQAGHQVHPAARPDFTPLAAVLGIDFAPLQSSHAGICRLGLQPGTAAPQLAGTRAAPACLPARSSGSRAMLLAIQPAVAVQVADCPFRGHSAAVILQGQLLGNGDEENKRPTSRSWGFQRGFGLGRSYELRIPAAVPAGAMVGGQTLEAIPPRATITPAQARGYSPDRARPAWTGGAPER